jgi:hypothetical protein
MMDAWEEMEEMKLLEDTFCKAFLDSWEAELKRTDKEGKYSLNQLLVHIGYMNAWDFCKNSREKQCVTEISNALEWDDEISLRYLHAKYNVPYDRLEKLRELTVRDAES